MCRFVTVTVTTVYLLRGQRARGGQGGACVHKADTEVGPAYFSSGLQSIRALDGGRWVLGAAWRGWFHLPRHRGGGGGGENLPPM